MPLLPRLRRTGDSCLDQLEIFCGTRAKEAFVDLDCCGAEVLGNVAELTTQVEGVLAALILMVRKELMSIYIAHSPILGLVLA